MIKFKKEEVCSDDGLCTILNTVTMDEENEFLWIEKNGDLYFIDFDEEEITFKTFQKGKKIIVEEPNNK